MNLLTFLGTGKYRSTTYDHEGVRVTTAYFSVAAAQFVAAKHVYVGLTEEARKHDNWSHLQRELEMAGCSVGPIDIPSGRSEAELWTVFNVLADAVADESDLALDVTHGFRSLPMLAVVLSAYLKAVGGPKISRILYGAYDAGESVSNVTPVFDLTAFDILLEWAGALRVFRVSGDSRGMADILKSYDRTLKKRCYGRDLYEAGASLTQLSEALALARPTDIASNAQKVVQKLGRPPVEQPTAAPFVRVAKMVAETYSDLQSCDLSGVLRMVRWYVQRRRYFQAVTLAREWLVSVAAERLGMTDIQVRRNVERALNLATVSRSVTDERADHDGPLDSDLYTECALEWSKLLKGAEHAILRRVWSDVRDFRNNLAHCGYQTQKLSCRRIQSKAEQLAAYVQDVHSETESHYRARGLKS